jgi:hypothetical protein
MKTVKTLVAFFVACAILMSCKSVSNPNNTNPRFEHSSKEIPLNAAAVPASVDTKHCAAKNDEQDEQLVQLSYVEIIIKSVLVGLIIVGFAVIAGLVGMEFAALMYKKK